MKNAEFVKRLIEVCKTSKPSDIQRTLGISHQAAVNYLAGRLPNAEILIRISDRTSCSIDWLLTGRGKKFLEESLSQDTPLSTGQIETIVGRFLVEVTVDDGEHPVRLKTVKLQSSDVLSEKVLDISNALTERKQ
jgi:hypothetical protein